MKRIIVATTISVLVLGLTLTALAQRKKAKPEEPKMKAELKLSDEQKQKLASIYRQSAKERIRLSAERQIAHIELQELLQATRPDQGVIDRKIDQLADLNRQLTQNRLQSSVASRSVLTKEQWAALKGKVGKGIMKHRQHRIRMFRFQYPRRGFGPGMGPGPAPGRPMGDESFEWEEVMPEEAAEMEDFEQFGSLDEPGFDMEFPPFEADGEFDMNFQPPSPSDDGWQ